MSPLGRTAWLFLAAWCTAVLPGHVHARGASRTYPVHIESQPVGATVYVEERRGGPLGRTPCDAELPAGAHTLIFELDGHETALLAIEVKERGGRQEFRVELQKLEFGTLEVALDDAGAARGAEVRIDGRMAGTAPASLRVPVGPHQIEVLKEGFVPFETWVEIKSEEATRLAPALRATVSASAPAAAPEFAPEGPGVRGAAAPVDPRLIVALGLALGGRHFSYDNPQTSNLRPYNARAIPLLLLGLEGYPLARQRGLLAGLGLWFDARLAAPVNSGTSDGREVSTRWYELAGGVRQVVQLGPASAAARVGLERQSFRFLDAGELLAEVPDVQYDLVRAGLDAGYRRGRLRVGAGADYLVVLRARPLAQRFAQSRADGLALSGLLAVQAISWLDVRLLGSYRHVRHRFETAPADMYVADGGADRYWQVALGAGARY